MMGWTQATTVIEEDIKACVDASNVKQIPLSATEYPLATSHRRIHQLSQNEGMNSNKLLINYSYGGEKRQYCTVDSRNVEVKVVSVPILQRPFLQQRLFGSQGYTKGEVRVLRQEKGFGEVG